MAKKNIDWENLSFGYIKTDKRFVSNFKDGKWDDGALIEDDMITMSECACVLQYSQTIFEGLKAYTTADGKIVLFRPDLNAERLANSSRRMEMPVFPEDKFVDAVVQTVKANADYVPPYGTGATLYVRPYMFGINPVIGVKPAEEFQFRVFTTPVGPYFKGGAKPITIKISDFDRAAPHGTGNIKAGLNYAMSLHAIVTAHNEGFAENMYLDAQTRTKVEETGGANFLFVTKDNKIVTPTSGSILLLQDVLLCMLPRNISVLRSRKEKYSRRNSRTLLNAVFAVLLPLFPLSERSTITAKRSASPAAWRKWVPQQRSFTKHLQVSRWAA